MIPRSWHHAWADLNGYFWKPCPRCGRMFGGHEWKGTDYYAKGMGKGTCCPGNRYLYEGEDAVVASNMTPEEEDEWVAKAGDGRLRFEVLGTHESGAAEHQVRISKDLHRKVQHWAVDHECSVVTAVQFLIAKGLETKR